jgi:RNA polymerase sigma-70 factor (subfamily 1)
MRIEEDLEGLIAAAKAGSSEAIGALLERYRPLLVKKARSRMSAVVTIKVGELAMVQEAFLAALQKFSEFNGRTEAEIVGWLSHILRHRVQDINKEFRRAKRDAGREVRLTKEIAETLQSKADQAGAVDDAHEREVTNAVQRTFELLPTQYRLIVWLHCGQEMSFEEVAHYMERSVAAVKKLWLRAIRRWQQQIAVYQQDPDGRASSAPGP